MCSQRSDGWFCADVGAFRAAVGRCLSQPATQFGGGDEGWSGEVEC